MDYFCVIPFSHCSMASRPVSPRSLGSGSFASGAMMARRWPFFVSTISYPIAPARHRNFRSRSSALLRFIGYFLTGAGRPSFLAASSSMRLGFSAELIQPALGKFVVQKLSRSQITLSAQLNLNDPPTSIFSRSRQLVG